jgi:hypothetical protein
MNSRGGDTIAPKVPDPHPDHLYLDWRHLRKIVAEYAVLMFIGVLMTLVLSALGASDTTGLILGGVSVVIAMVFIRPWRDVPTIAQHRRAKPVPR